MRRIKIGLLMMMEQPGFLHGLVHQSNKWRTMLLLLFLTAHGTTQGELYSTEGPQLTQEPGRTNYFSNDQGLLLHCNAKGNPHPQIEWMVQSDGQPVVAYKGIREIFPNGSIYFPPFSVSFYRPDVHNQVYVCTASNSVGRVRSRDIHVKAVINQRYEIRVDDAYPSEGNDALLRCSIPEHVKDFVSVTSWNKDSNLNIIPHSGAGGRYIMTPSGDLLIEEVSRNDSSSSFRCRTVNRLTGETQLSENSARLQLSGGSESKQLSAPSIKLKSPSLNLQEGEAAVLLCISEGHPSPVQWWFRRVGYGRLENLRPSERLRIHKSAVIIENVGMQDSGIYLCHSNNSHGSDEHQIQLRVTSALVVQVVPSLLTVDIGKSADFTCWTNSPDESSQSFASSPTPRQITWRKDGIEIRSSLLKLSVNLKGDKLQITNVQREDKGIYQCFVKTDSEMVQASSELRLGDAAPQLVYRFIEQTLRPGPSVSLKCSALGNPTPQISWLLDGFPLIHSERLLIGQYVTLNGDVVSHVNITSTKVDDGGEFKCVAKNKLGVSAHSARLNIYGIPLVRSMPNSLTAVAGKDFTIKCPVAGYPISSITWEKDGQSLPLTRRQLVTPDGTLTIKDVDRSVDSGWYSCIASNKQGSSDRKGIQLQVVVPPKLVPFSFPEETKEGERIFATCVVSEGDVPVRLQWLKDMQVVGDTSRDPGSDGGSDNSYDKRIGHGNPNVGSGFRSSITNSRLPSTTTSDISIHRIGDFDALLLQITHVKAHDAGNYTCLAHNQAGQVSHTTQLVIHVPPRIAPFSFPAQVWQGSRVQAVCSVEQGDLEDTNLTVSWLKDSDPLTGDRLPYRGRNLQSLIKIVHVDAYSAMLIIDRVDSSHSGNYTCRISNSVEEVYSTVPLVVRVPPKWIFEPKETEVTAGSPVVIPCQADGFPTPTISWKKSIGDRPENYRDIPFFSIDIHGGKLNQIQNQQQKYGGVQTVSVFQSSSEEAFFHANGTLVIQWTKKAHQGIYLCEASNGIGTGLSKVIRLIVNVPVQVKEPLQNVTSRVGGKATLRCEISGDPPITEIGWKRGIGEIKPENDIRFQMRTLNTTQGVFSELTVNNVGREDTARYLCSAANNHGRSQGAIWLYVQEPPDTPRNLHVVAKGSRFVRLGWILTQDGNSPITQFIIKFKQELGTKDFQEIQVQGQQFSETVGNLRPSTKYLFYILAQNLVGQSEKSEILEIKTDGEKPEGRARNVRVAAVSSSDIQVTWEHPEKDTWHGQLVGYYVGFKRYRETEDYQFITVDKKEGLQEYLVKALNAFTSYEIVVQAYNGEGAGPMSESIVATTLEDVPISAPDGLHCSALNSQNLQLGWNPLSSEQARGLIKGYKAHLERTDFDRNESNEPPLIRSTPSTNLVFSGLAKSINYSVQIQAYTVAGEGPKSLPIHCMTDEDLPGAPANVKALVVSSSSMIATWLPPEEPNGVITKYNVYITSVETSGKSKDSVKRRKQVPSDTLKHQFDGLKVDEKYEIKVTASTKVGDGKPIITYRIQTKSTPSSILSFGVDHHIVWKSDVRLTCESVGASSVLWTRNADLIRDSDRLSINQDGSLGLRSVRREDGGNYTCSLINGNRGHVLESITYRLIVIVPPMGPLVTAIVRSHSSITLEWEPSDSGGALIKGYKLHKKVADEWEEQRLDRLDTKYDLKQLQCGTLYQIYMTAYNKAGPGSKSQTLNVSTFGGSPLLSSQTVPQFMVETNRTRARVKLKDVWSDNGCSITAFKVFHKKEGDNHWTSGPDLDGVTRSMDIVGLKAGNQYKVKVIAMNSAGSSEAEVTINTPDELIDSNTPFKPRNNEQFRPFYLNMDFMIPALICISVGFAMCGCSCIYCMKKSPQDCHTAENYSSGTPTSSTYFKNNQRNSQVFMTVKKPGPVKGVDMTDLEQIPQYPDEICPYATFELNESRRDSKVCAAGMMSTLDRRRAQGHDQWNREVVQDKSRSNSKGQIFRPGPGPVDSKQEESDEYDSYCSDTDTDNLPMSKRKSPYRGKLVNGAHAKLGSKFEDYESQTHLGNRYEFCPPGNSAGPKYPQKPRQAPNEINGTVMADPYFYNDAYPTLVEEACKPYRGTRSRRMSSRKSQGQLTSAQERNGPPGQESVYSTKIHGLEPPHEFMDPTDQLYTHPISYKNHSGNDKPANTAANEYTIAV